MRKTVAVLATAALSLAICQAFAHSIPFPDLRRTYLPDGKSRELGDLIDLLKLGVNYTPYLLGRYLNSGDVLYVEQIRASSEAVDQYLKSVGKSVNNDQEKELFVKLTAGCQTLKENIANNVKAIGEFRIAARAFDERFGALLERIESDIEALDERAWGTDKTSDSPTMRLLDNIRVSLLKAASLSRMASGGQADESRRKKAREMWDVAVRQADLFATAASSDREKKMAATLQIDLKRTAQRGRNILIRGEELNQAWQETLAGVESIESLIEGHSAPKKPAAQPEPDKALPAK
jgi:hypothetical protein